MNLPTRFRLRRSRFFLLILGLITLFAVVVLGATTLPAISIALSNATVGDYSNGLSVLPTGNIITPTAAPGAMFERLATDLRSDDNADAAEAVATTLSPDGKTLLALTSGYNQNFNTTSGTSITYPVLDPISGAPSSVTTKQAEWVFVYSVGNDGSLAKQQQINLPNTYNGIAWAPDGQRFYVSAGIDDRIYVYRLEGNQFVPDAPFIVLGHNSNETAPLPKYDGGLLKGTPAALAATGAVVAGIDVSKDGKTLVAANFENDSISVVDTQTRKVIREIKFFQPGQQTAIGEFPFDVAVVSHSNGAADKAFVTSQRDDEVMVVDLNDGSFTRITVGQQPNKLLLSKDQTRLYVANGNSDTVSVIDTRSNRIIKTLSLARNGERYKGSIPNSLALDSDEKNLYVTLGGENAVAVVNLSNTRVVGRIPTGWYPNSVSVGSIGKKLYVVNAKRNSGPNPSNSRTTDAGKARNTTFRNEYNWALEKAGISTIPIPNRATLIALNQRVNINNGFDNSRTPDSTMRFLKNQIKHVVYVVKENRTYDQVLGDLPVGNGDSGLTLFPQPISPNHHKLAQDYVTLDNFYDSGESSGVGWSWSTFAATTDYTEKSQSVLYGNANFNGLTYDYEGQNRNITLALPQTASNPSQFTARETGLLDPSGQSSILPGTGDVNAPAGDGNLRPEAIGGYIWDVALRAGKTVRNYGFHTTGSYYTTSLPDPTVLDPANPTYIPVSPTPFASGIPQSPVAKSTLLDKTDLFFRGYDQNNADIYLYQEWLRDLGENGLPNLSLIRLSHDHFGSFQTAIAGLNTAPAQMADNDYAVGQLIETLSKRPDWKETAVFIIEDDSQNGPDHIDSHRSIAYVISPYTKRNTVVSSRYTTVNMLRTIENILGTGYMGINDANAKPMSDVFTQTADLTPYTAIVPGILCQSPVDSKLVPACQDPNAPKSVAMKSLHDGDWWASATKDFYFGVEDKLDPEAFNRVLWAGIKGENVPYPTERSGLDLSQNRELLVGQHSSQGLQKQT
jgi:YVTN family beta-propeller protein